MAVSAEELEQQQAELEPPAAGEQPEETSTQELTEQETQLATQEDAVGRQLADLQRQLSRMESRYDRGGSDAVSIRQLQGQVGQLAQRLEGIQDMRELIDGLLEANVPPEKLAILKVKQAETRATRAEQRAKAVEEQATREVNLKPETPNRDFSNVAPVVQAAMESAGLTQDKDTAARLDSMLPTDILSRPDAEIIRLTTAAIFRIRDEADEGAKAQAGRRTATREAVRTDRSAAGGGSGGGSYDSYEALCTAHMNGEIDTTKVAAIKSQKGW